MSLRPWREVAVPHEDVLRGTFQQAEFAADLAAVHTGTAPAEYSDPVRFFQRTFITEGMRLLLDSVLKRLTGRGGEPVIQLQTAFGGGKTHTLLAVYHLAKGEAAISDLRGVAAVLDGAGIRELPRARVAVIDGNELSPDMPRQRGELTIRTLWGDLAWQLGGPAAYERVAAADLAGTSPGKEALTELLSAHAPCAILVDELVSYVRQFWGGGLRSGGSYDSILSFIQALTEALKAVPTAVMLASLPASQREAGGEGGEAALASLSYYFARIQALWKPVATEEAFEIVRRRLFTEVTDQGAAEAVCRAFADYYITNSSDFPHETQDSHYYDRLRRAYPIHPEVFDRLYTDWSSLDRFQRTRGVLKLMAKVIHRLWQDGNNDPLIMPGSLPLYDGDTRNEAIYYLPQGWDPVVERDIDGGRAETADIENHDPRLGSVQACRRTARAVFLGSAPTAANQLARGLEAERVILGAAQPGQQTGVYKDALRRLTDRLHYLNHANERYWFDTRPNLRREMEERRSRFNDREHVFPRLRDRLQSEIGPGLFDGVHVFRDSADIPDDAGLRLVVLPPDAGFSRAVQEPAIKQAVRMLSSHGEQPRIRQNRLLFLAADYDTVSRLRDQVRTVLAWESIVADIKVLNLDQYQSLEAQRGVDNANAALKRLIRETYRWLLVPAQQATLGKTADPEWEHYSLNPGAPGFAHEIERVLRENELVIYEWSPIHLKKLLQDWFWRDGINAVSALDVWQKTCCYLYLPRLSEQGVFRVAIEKGTDSADFFGLAYGVEPAGQDDSCKYIGFSFNKPTAPALDGSLLLIEPTTAARYAEQQAQEHMPPSEPAPGPKPSPDGGTGRLSDRPQPPTIPVGPKPTAVRRFYGSVAIDPVRATMAFADVVNEVVAQFTQELGVQVRIRVDIEAETDAGGGFGESLQRNVRENCNALKFTQAEFER